MPRGMHSDGPAGDHRPAALPRTVRGGEPGWASGFGRLLKCLIIPGSVRPQNHGRPARTPVQPSSPRVRLDLDVPFFFTPCDQAIREAPELVLRKSRNGCLDFFHRAHRRKLLRFPPPFNEQAPATDQQSAGGCPAILPSFAVPYPNRDNARSPGSTVLAVRHSSLGLCRAGGNGRTSPEHGPVGTSERACQQAKI